jgi:predicted Holliday junction resolvase-like endonuclease
MNEPMILMVLILFCMFLKIIWDLQEVKELKSSIDMLLDILVENEVQEEIMKLYEEKEGEEVLTKSDLKGDY